MLDLHTEQHGYSEACVRIWLTATRCMAPVNCKFARRRFPYRPLEEANSNYALLTAEGSMTNLVR